MDDPQKRIKQFMDEYGELVKRLEVDIISMPSYMPDGEGGFRLVIDASPVDLRRGGIPSPFITQ